MIGYQTGLYDRDRGLLKIRGDDRLIEEARDAIAKIEAAAAESDLRDQAHANAENGIKMLEQPWGTRRSSLSRAGMNEEARGYDRQNLNTYESLVAGQVEEWRDEREGALKKALDAAGLPVEKLYELLPDTGRKTLERAVLGAMEMLRDASRWSYPDAGIVREARKLGIEVDDYRDLRFHDLEDLDRLARRYFGTNKVIAALEGAGCGMGGIALVAADIPALFGVSFRAVQQIGSCYGFDMEDPEMAPLVMSVFNVGSSASGAAKAAALVDMQVAAKAFAVNWGYEKIAKRSATGAVARLLKESTKHLPREIAQNITKRKLAQTIPVVGAAVGAGFNYWFMSNTTRGAYMLFRHMYLMRKYQGSGPDIAGARSAMT